MKFQRTDHFKQDFKSLPERIRRRAETALRFLSNDLRHPSLHVKKMKGERDLEGHDIWEARVTRGYRFTFAIEGEICILYRVGPHDVERRPR